MKVFITSKIPVAAEEKLTGAGFEVFSYGSSDAPDSDEIIKYAEGADALITLLTDKINREVIDKLESCKVIANYAVGYNNIDVRYANEKGIVVTNTPDILTNATADLTMALILGCARRIKEGDDLMRSGKFGGWKPQLLLGAELYGKTIGIIGAGRIGGAVAKRARAFGLKVVYCNRNQNTELEIETGAVKKELSELVRESDIISLHVPLTDETRNMLDSRMLEKMKKSAILINTARGEVIDEKYLVKMLKSKRIMAAGLDVYANEPDVNEELFGLENVLLSPHTGSATNETREKMALLCADNIIAVLNGKPPLTEVH